MNQTSSYLRFVDPTRLSFASFASTRVFEHFGTLAGAALAPIVMSTLQPDEPPMECRSPRHRSPIVVLLLFALAGAHLPLHWIMKDPAAIAWSPTESILGDASFVSDASVLSDAAIPAAVMPSMRPPAVPTDVTLPARPASSRTSSTDGFSSLRI